MGGGRRSAPWRIDAHGQHGNKEKKGGGDTGHHEIEIRRGEHDCLRVDPVCKFAEAMGRVDALACDDRVVA